ncbi:MAG TPA: class III extradiol dioxygenase family protein [Bordetella sp.]
MAELIGGIGASHSPSIAMAYDRRQEADPAWAPFFEAAETLRAQVAQARPDVLVFFYNDHLWHFDLDLVPTFALGVAEQFELAPERPTQRPLPAARGHADLAWHIARSLVAQEFDIATSQRLALDHGFFSVMPLICDPPWPVKVIPVAVNMIQHPLPTPARCWKLGQAVARAVASYPGSQRVMMVGTGGLSHQLHGPNFGYTNPAWDQAFMDSLVHEPQSLLALTHDDYMQRGGAESVEMIVWLIMRAALRRPEIRLRAYHGGLLTGLGLLHLAEAGISG